jgi:hypothetical protein
MVVRVKALVVRASRRIQAPGLGYEIHDRLRNYCYVSYVGEGKCDKFAQKMTRNTYRECHTVIPDTKSRDGHHSHQEHPGYHKHQGIMRGHFNKTSNHMYSYLAVHLIHH